MQVGTADRISTDAQGLWDRVLEYSEDGVALIESITKSKEILVDMYDEAYNDHVDTLREARAEIQDRQFWIDFVLGVAASAAVTMTGGVALELAIRAVRRRPQQTRSYRGSLQLRSEALSVPYLSKKYQKKT